MAGPYRLSLGALGWRHEQWSGSFYPEDLPADWRLTYYSNEFPLVLVPQPDWSSETDFRAWVGDVHPHFRFLLEYRSNPDVLVRAVEGLGAACAGAVARNVPEAVDALPCPLYLDDAGDAPGGAAAQPVWRPHRVCGQSRLALLDAEEVADLRALRGVIEAFAEQAPAGEQLMMILEGQPPPVRRLREAEIIAGLLP